jgi:hypothetical protein
MLKYTPHSGILKLRFESILADPAWAAHVLKGFCPGAMLDEKAMATQVRPRGPECLSYMLELEQLEEANGRDNPQ